MVNSSETRSFGSQFARLPSPPAILIELIDSCNDPKVGLDRLAAIIGKDAALTAKVISAAHSPFYRQWQEIDDLNRLLVVLGAENVRNIAITSAVQQFFKQLGHKTGRTLDRIWYHSLVCAHCARSLAALSAYPKGEEAYLTGLLHRLGQLALLQNHPEAYRLLVEREISSETLLQAETATFGYTSPAVAAELIGRWKLRACIADAVRDQYQPAQAIFESCHLVKLINLAAHLAPFSGKPDNKVLERADRLFGLQQAIVEELLQESREEATAIARGLDIALPSQSDDPLAHKQQQALGERVRQAALFGGLGSLSEQNDLPAILEQIQRDLDLLFGLDRSCFLLWDTETQSLHPVDPTPGADNPPRELAFSIREAPSLAGRAFAEQRPRTTLDEDGENTLDASEHQLLGYLRSEVLIYLPLSGRRQNLGLLAIGADTAQGPVLEEQRDLLTLFAREAAQALLRRRQCQEAQRQTLDDTQAAFQLQARKIVHEANNPLGIINNYLHILDMKLGEAHPVKAELGIIREEIERVSKIILRMRDIPEEAEPQETPVDINQLVTDLDRLFQPSLFIPNKISAGLDLDRSMPAIRTQRNHIKQILTNLVKNAVEAMPEGGRLTITTRDHADLNGKPHIEIQIGDDGPGIPPEIMARLFTPVTSTKDTSHSGLGLAIVKNLMDELSGTINCASSPCRGSRFQLYLPRSGIAESGRS